MAQPVSTLIDNVTANLHTVANMHLPPPPAVPQPPLLHIPAAEQRVVTKASDTGTSLEQRHPLVPGAGRDSLIGPNILLHAPQRPSIPVPPHITTSSFQPASANTALNLDDRGQPLTYASAKAGTNAPHWQHAESEELDRLLATHTIRPLQYSDQPLHRRQDTTYYNPQTKEKETPDGRRTYRIRGTIGGDRVNYPGPTTARTAAMSLVKILIHSVISDNAQWLTIDIKDFYLSTPLPRPEYPRIQSKFLPTDIIVKHNLTPYLRNDSVLFEVNKGKYGLPQAGLLAQQRLITHLAKHGYHQTNTACLLRHGSNGTVFSLVVDDFGIKYTTKQGAQHLITTLQTLYPITIDWTGAKYLGFSIQFNRSQRTVTLAMPGYIAKTLQRFAPTLTSGANSPAIHIPPDYGVGQQTPHVDTSEPLSNSETSTLDRCPTRWISSILCTRRRCHDPTCRHSFGFTTSTSHTTRTSSFTTLACILCQISK